MDTRIDSTEFLREFSKERVVPLLAGVYEGAFDQPHFTVDQRYQPLEEPPYPVG